MRELVFMLEEQSAQEMLEKIVPRLLSPETQIVARYIKFEGKQDLDKQLHPKLSSYLNPDARFIILRDQDSSDCLSIKSDLASLCNRAGRSEAIIRIACHELEAFYLGGLTAVEIGLGIAGIACQQTKAKFRNPDSLISPARQLERLTKNRYQKLAGSRAIAPHLNLENCGSRSFHNLVQAIRHTAFLLGDVSRP